MIPKEMEIKIHALLDRGARRSAIATKLGVPHQTVCNIHAARCTCDSVPRETRKLVYALLTSGLSVRTVAGRLGLPTAVVLAIRRVDTAFTNHCPTCGAAIFLHRPNNDEDAYVPSKTPRHITKQQAEALFRIADDIVGLASESVVPNLLFYEISKRCEGVVSIINGGKRGEEKNAG